MSYYPSLTDSDLNSVMALRDSLGGRGGSVVPSRCFVLGKAALVSMVAAISTYMVMLLQFKLSEK